MQVQKTTEIYKIPSFKSCSRVYKSIETPIASAFKQEEIYTTSGPFRKHIKWQEFIPDLIKHFGKKKTVNIYSLGCSDGSEAYSYAMAIADRVSKNEFKKYSILASDIDSEVIRAANTRKINFDTSDVRRIKENLRNGNDFESRYFVQYGEPVRIFNDMNPDFHTVSSPLRGYKPIGAIRDVVRFYESDALTEIRKINDTGNSIVNTCHILGYCSEEYVENVLNALSQKLKSGSWYVYDKMCNSDIHFKNKLKELGFFFPKENSCYAQKL